MAPSQTQTARKSVRISYLRIAVTLLLEHPQPPLGPVRFTE
jgi:hypothetical protein